MEVGKNSNQFILSHTEHMMMDVFHLRSEDGDKRKGLRKRLHESGAGEGNEEKYTVNIAVIWGERRGIQEI